MRNPISVLVNLCAFSLLALAVYLNFVELNKTDHQQPARQEAPKQKTAAKEEAQHRIAKSN